MTTEIHTASNHDDHVYIFWAHLDPEALDGLFEDYRADTGDTKTPFHEFCRFMFRQTTYGSN